ncbi:RusA family crossover junction endodeoxyribonuclease [Candidatus Pacearchaeota archaeon]|nr:RusA family crossover junction endodeoxyribonuclease [Candidatus Pacearchaeota archaeon]
MVNVKSSKTCGSPYVFLEDYEFCHGGLIEIATGKRKQMIKKIREGFSADNPPVKLKKELLDVAIVVHIRSGRHRWQDLDNLAKIILDAFEKPKDSEDKYPYLYENDNQIVRLLLIKRERVEYPDSETSQLSISVRKHDPDKEMVLKELKHN